MSDPQNPAATDRPRDTGSESPLGRDVLIRDERHWFAAFAMHAIISQKGVPETQESREEMALWAFRMGEAMVKVGHQLHAGA